MQQCAPSPEDDAADWAAMTEDVRRAARREGAPVDEVVESLGDCELADWRAGQFGPAEMAAYAKAVKVRVGMERGERPEHYNEIATCRHCGPIWLWARGEVMGCPWCFNRVAGRPIPRPIASQCGDCVHFRRLADHQHLGHCAVGEPEDANGLWDTDQRVCLRAERPPDTH